MSLREQLDTELRKNIELRLRIDMDIDPASEVGQYVCDTFRPVWPDGVELSEVINADTIFEYLVEAIT